MAKWTARLRVVSEKGVDSIALQRRVQQLFRGLEVPEGYELGVRGSAEQFLNELRDVGLAMLLGLVLIFVVMGVLFESVALPFSVLFSIPFMFVGSMLLVYLMGESLTGTAAIGYVILLGIVVNNAIVLIDCINRFRSQGSDRIEAIVEAGKARLRPIVMTACTTVCGLTPLVVIRQTGEGLDYRPLAVIVMGGLTVSTLFTLLVVPLFYTLFEDLSKALRAGLRRRRRR